MAKAPDPFDCIEESELSNSKSTDARDLAAYMAEVEKEATTHRRHISRESRQTLFVIFGIIIAAMLVFLFFNPFAFVGVVFALIGLLIYFLPTFVAISNNHINAAAIVILNIFLGWTFLGWVIALVWACMESQRQS